MNPGEAMKKRGLFDHYFMIMICFIKGLNVKKNPGFKLTGIYIVVTK